MNKIYEQLIAYKEKGIDMVVVTAIEKQGEGPVEVGKKMIVTTDNLHGTVGGGALEHGAVEIARELLQKRTHLTEKYFLNEGRLIKGAKTLPMVCGGTVTLFYEFVGVKNFVYIFGAGHVGQALARVLKPLDFHLTVIDDRQAVIERFEGADVIAHQPFASFIDDHGIKDNSFVVVCTPSHKYDYNVINKILEQTLKPQYIGMLCSMEKLKSYLDKTYETFGKDIDLRHFYSPIGLDLGGGSPEEIAIAIAAEILAIHHGKQEHRHMRGNLNDQNRYW